MEWTILLKSNEEWTSDHTQRREAVRAAACCNRLIREGRGASHYGLHDWMVRCAVHYGAVLRSGPEKQLPHPTRRAAVFTGARG